MTPILPERADDLQDLALEVTPKGEVRMGFPIHAAGWIFPDLFPALFR
jgi:hypothetical protein